MKDLSDLYILEWNTTAGADEIIGENPADFYTAAQNISSDKTKTVAQVPTPDMTKDTQASPVVTLAQSASPTQPEPTVLDNITTLEELRQAIESFNGCALKKTATNTVFCDGCPTAKIMLIGEAPGADEDRMGKAFVGRSGQLLDKMLASVNLSRNDTVYISNIIPWRPPGNRTPSVSEVAACLPFIKKHIELINPDLILLLGKSSSSALLGTTESISLLRGKLFDYHAQTRTIPALVTFHPAFLLREPLQKRLAWQDMLKLQKTLKELKIYQS